MVFLYRSPVMNGAYRTGSCSGWVSEGAVSEREGLKPYCPSCALYKHYT